MLSLRFICKAPITHYNTLRRAGSIRLSSKGLSSMGFICGKGNCADSRSLGLEGGPVLRAMKFALLLLLSVAAVVLNSDSGVRI